MQHFRLFEFWRLSAAMLVVIYHFLWHAPPEDFIWATRLYRLLPLLDMFFMISGFLIMLRYADKLLTPAAYGRFLLRRIARLYPLYLVTLVFFVVVGVAVSLGIVSTGSPERFDFSVLLHNILLIQAWGTTDALTFNYVAWSLSAEWFCYLLLPLLAIVLRRYGPKGLILLAVACMLALEAAAAADLVPFETWLDTNTWGAYRAFIDFAVGGAVAIIVRDSALTWRSHGPAWAVFGLAITAMLTIWSGYAVFVLLAISLFLAGLAERNNPDGSRFLSPLHPVAKASFSIYLIHPVVELLLFSGLWRLLVEPMGAINFYAFWLLPLFLTIALAVMSDRYFEAPVNRWLVDRWDRRDRAAAQRLKGQSAANFTPTSTPPMA